MRENSYDNLNYFSKKLTLFGILYYLVIMKLFF